MNACILLIRMECKRFISQWRLAWAMATELTSRSKVEYDEVFSNISSFDFTINVSKGLLDCTCLVRRHVNSKSRVGGTVTIPKEPIRGSYFGKCTCGLDTRDTLPCEHMAAVAASSHLPGVTRHNAMPYWWTRAHWCMQIPQEALGITNVSMSSIIADNEPDHNLCYCPD